MPIEVKTAGPLFSREASRRVGDVIRAEFNTLGKSLVAQLRLRARKDTKAFEQSIRFRITGAGIKTTLVVYADSASAKWAEEGRKPGKAPPLRPTGNLITRGKNKGKPQMESILVDWLARRGIGATASERRGKAYRIGQKIARVGVKGSFIFRDLKTDNAAEINAAYTVMGQKIAQLLNG